MYQTDSEIIKKVLAGDRALYSLLVNRYKGMAFTLAYNIILNREDAEEVTQDAFMKAFAGLRNFKEQSSFSTWLYRIVVNASLNKKKRSKFLIDELSDEALYEDEGIFDVLLERTETEAQKKYIQLALHSLKDVERICITMFYLNEFSVKEINELTGISETNIKVLLFRGRKHLYDKLKSLLKSEIRNLI